MGYVVPGVGLWQNYRASQDAMKYIQENGSPEEIKAAYRSVSPAFAMRTAAPFSAISEGPVALTAIAAGHVSGQVKAAMVKNGDSREKSLSDTREVKYSEPITTASPESSPANPNPLR